MQSTRYFCQILMKLKFLDRFSKNTHIRFHEICLVGAELFYVDGQRDMAKLMVAFRSFAKEPKNLPINSKFG
jgi:hypothetical protein